MNLLALSVLGIAIILVPISRGQVASTCDPWIAKVVSAQGSIEVKRHTRSRWLPVQLDDVYCAGDRIRTAIHSRAGLLLRNQTVLRLDQGTTLVLPELKKEESAWLELIRGAIHIISNIPYKLKVKTPFVNAAIEGTEFAIRVTQKETHTWVFEGKVITENKHGYLSLEKGDVSVTEPDKAPSLRVVINPRNAVQWALYYPPILGYQPEITQNPSTQQALEFFYNGQTNQALASLAKTAHQYQDVHYFTLRAGLLLNVGRVEEARKDISQAQTLEPDNGTALALLSIIALTQHEAQKALQLAQTAAEKDPQSPTPQIALSYAYQALFELNKARNSLKKALKRAAGHPLVWARLSELNLSLGDLEGSLKAAQKASTLNPNLSRTQMVLGFAYLAQIKLNKADEAFQRAIQLDPASPLPHLGRGLVKIRRGHVKEGTQDVEVASILDPSNALVRSYLGKAYYEDKRGHVAHREFTMAKELDPKDPTPWFYQAILRQTENQPVKALNDMQTAIELNDSRAVYRSRLLLDEDLAARSASLGRIYNDLGFQQLGLVEGWKSVNRDPGNYSAHRLLADNYAGLPRHEIARVSELLQSQLLQPINIMPIQPQLAESNLLILDSQGVAKSSYNEFNPLFMGNRLSLQTSAIIGSNNTYSDEITQSGIWNNFSYSLGQFHFETDGFRENNDLRQDIFNIFSQIAITTNINLQFEYRRKITEQGDLRLNFDPENFSPINRRTRKDHLFRLGSHFSLSPQSDFLFSAIYKKGEGIDESTLTIPNLPDGFAKVAGKDEGYDIQAQYLFSADGFNVVTGLGTSRRNINLRVSQDFTSTFGVKCLAFNKTCNYSPNRHPDQYNGYLYARFTWPESIKWTLGFSYDLTEQNRRKTSRFNPKAGVQWKLTDRVALRLAYFKTVKRSLVENQTLEPTQVSGFNQFFDDINFSHTERYGMGIDAQLKKNIHGSIEISRRNLKVPFTNILTSKAIFHDKHEYIYHGYLYWTLGSTWALSTKPRFEIFQNRHKANLGGLPTRIEMLTIPLGLRYFNANGFFAEINPTYVWQKVNLSPLDSFRKNSDEFFLTDLTIGYRLPKRLGIISLNIQNLFNTNFLLQDVNLQEQKPSNPIYSPERTILGRISLNF